MGVAANCRLMAARLRPVVWAGAPPGGWIGGVADGVDGAGGARADLFPKVVGDGAEATVGGFAPAAEVGGCCCPTEVFVAGCDIPATWPVAGGD